MARKQRLDSLCASTKLLEPCIASGYCQCSGGGDDVVVGVGVSVGVVGVVVVVVDSPRESPKLLGPCIAACLPSHCCYCYDHDHDDDHLSASTKPHLPKSNAL